MLVACRAGLSIKSHRSQRNAGNSNKARLPELSRTGSIVAPARDCSPHGLALTRMRAPKRQLAGVPHAHPTQAALTGQLELGRQRLGIIVPDCPALPTVEAVATALDAPRERVQILGLVRDDSTVEGFEYVLVVNLALVEGRRPQLEMRIALPIPREAEHLQRCLSIMHWRLLQR